MTYVGIYEDAITLKGGRWAGEPYVNSGISRPLVGIVKDFMLTGDLDGDGSKEVAAILTESTGGSGNRSYCHLRGERRLSAFSVGHRGSRRCGVSAHANLSDPHVLCDYCRWRSAQCGAGPRY